jgi:hypothetical protein
MGNPSRRNVSRSFNPQYRVRIQNFLVKSQIARLIRSTRPLLLPCWPSLVLRGVPGVLPQPAVCKEHATYVQCRGAPFDSRGAVCTRDRSLEGQRVEDLPTNKVPPEEESKHFLLIRTRFWLVWLTTVWQPAVKGARWGRVGS